ncbi:MAG: hypothetical protein ACTSWE_04065 [Promethearchaeota archaeon]
MIICTFHYYLFYDYIVDDVAIIMGSTKVFIDHGRFSIDQHAEKVEAWSSPAWWMLLSIIYFLGLDLIKWVKILGHVFSIFTIGIVLKINREIIKEKTFEHEILSISGGVSLSLMTGFVIWNSSGLENSLFTFSTARMILGALRYIKFSKNSMFIIFSCLISVVRPEGFLYPFILMMILLLENKRFGAKLKIKNLFPFLTLTIFNISFYLIRYGIFSWFFSNTYYAKVISSGKSQY